MVFLAGCGAVDDTDARVTAIVATAGDVDAGARVFAARCAPCHGAAGEGTTAAPALGARFAARDDAAIARVILTGSGQMPGNPSLSDRDVAAVIAWGRGALR